MGRLSPLQCAEILWDSFLLEHPEDPQRYRKQTPDVQSCSSLWRTIMWKEFRDTFSLDELHLDQGALGHIAVKPTTLGTNLSGLMDLQGLRVDPAEFKGPITHVGPMGPAT